MIQLAALLIGILVASSPCFAGLSNETDYRNNEQANNAIPRSTNYGSGDLQQNSDEHANLTDCRELDVLKAGGIVRVLDCGSQRHVCTSGNQSWCCMNGDLCANTNGGCIKPEDSRGRSPATR